MGMQAVGIRLQMEASGFVSSAQNIADAFSKITEKIKEAQSAGNTDLAQQYTKQATNLQHIYNGMAQGSAQNSTQGGTQGSHAGKAIPAVQGAASAAQRAVSQAGSGDVIGAGISGTQGGLDIIGKLGDKASKAAGIMGVGLLPLMLGNTLSNFYEKQMTDAMDINGALHNTMRKTVNR